MTNPQLEEELGVWQMEYNYHRKHSSLGLTPVEQWQKCNQQTPYWEDIVAAFDPQKETAFQRRLTLDRKRRSSPKK